MDLRPLDDITSVAPQLQPDDFAVLAESRVRAIICNRPDTEVPPGQQAAAMQAAAHEAGLTFTHIPVALPHLGLDVVKAHAAAIDAAEGPVVAYCASGTRSTVLWALAMAGRKPTDDILAATAAAGYPLDGLRSQIDTLEAQP